MNYNMNASIKVQANFLAFWNDRNSFYRTFIFATWVRDAEFLFHRSSTLAARYALCVHETRRLVDASDRHLVIKFLSLASARLGSLLQVIRILRYNVNTMRGFV